MALIKCDNCGKEISNRADSCVYCGVKLDDNKKQVDSKCHSDAGIKRNIKFFLTLAKVLKIIIFIFAGLVFLIGIMTQNTKLFVICFVESIICCLVAVLSTNSLEWKAYVLKNLYELNKKE